MGQVVPVGQGGGRMGQVSGISGTSGTSGTRRRENGTS